MKKIMSGIILIIMLILLPGCSCGKNPEISYKYNSITINIGDTYEVSDTDIEIQYATRDYRIIVLDESIASVSGNIITPLKKGKTTIRILLDEDVYVDVPLNVTHIIYAQDASVASDLVRINLTSDNIAYNKILLSESCNEVPRVTYERDVIDFDYVTGKITAKQPGETTVVVLFRNCNVSFRVIVSDKVFVKQFIIDDHKMFVGNEGKFNFSVFPSSANVYSFSTTDSNIINVSNDGYYRALNSGKASIAVEYSKSDTQVEYIEFEVEVLEPITDLDTTITQENGEAVDYLLVDEIYKLTLSNISLVSTEDITLEGSVGVSEIKEVTNGYDVYFAYNSSGNVKIDVVIDMGGGLKFVRAITTRVFGYEDIEVVGSWSYYELLPTNNVYELRLGGGASEPSYINFVLKIDEYEVSQDYKIYDISSGVRVEVESHFEPTEIGEYLLEFVMSDRSIKTIKIIVK